MADSTSLTGNMKDMAIKIPSSASPDEGVNPETGKQEEIALVSQTTTSPSTPERQSDSLKTFSKLRILKNLIIMSSSLFMLLAAHMAVESLQSTINKEDGLGFAGLSLLYFSGIVSCLFLPPVVIAKLGCKWTMVISMVTYISYLAAGFHATWATILPTSVLLGIGAANLWSAQLVYTSTIGAAYATKTGTEPKHVMMIFTGILYSFVTAGHIPGNLIASQVLRKPMSSNISVSECGLNFCPLQSSNTSALAETDINQVRILSGVLLGIGCCGALLMVIFLDNIKPSGQQQNQTISTKTLSLTVKHIWNSRTQKCLLPAGIFRGIARTFLAGKIAAGYIGCIHGVGNIGYMMIVYGVTSSVVSTLLGHLANKTGIVFIYMLGLISHLSILVTLLFWGPSEDLLYPLIIMTAVWAIGASIFQSVLAATYTELCPDNQVEASTTFTCFSFLGSSLSYGYSTFLCTRVEIYVTMATLCVAVALVIYAKHLSRSTNTMTVLVTK